MFSQVFTQPSSTLAPPSTPPRSHPATPLPALFLDEEEEKAAILLLALVATTPSLADPVCPTPPSSPPLSANTTPSSHQVLFLAILIFLLNGPNSSGLHSSSLPAPPYFPLGSHPFLQPPSSTSSLGPKSSQLPLPPSLVAKPQDFTSKTPYSLMPNFRYVVLSLGYNSS